ncbi:hypothetical protein KXX33_007266 [Aspergillus fumigatus]|nr:hypothetical protein KXX45_005386 [Aspergillus fumigatus]KAH1356354.1 hypothetical protein KXX33_007266 [Aspergillus fumigatus]KAH1742790.1 hypothetical protein KXX09_000666 [Aspergillus fumigatus]KAH1872147.1 hypothetical protein KXX01_007876 [Aspergillus fumigatus]KAH1874224.1 hypothetical protein KXW95_005447 [Aspergillus fumigatus]
MGKFYPSITPDLHDWTLRQSVFFVASAPLRGKHINVSPKGLPNASFAILGPNEAAYIDATGSGSETICHLRENGRITVLFCSFDAAPRILRLFCSGSVIEWDQPEFGAYLERMGNKSVLGARAIIRLDVYKVQTSCGFGVPQLALKLDPETHEPKPYLKDRETLGHFVRKSVEKGQLRSYQREWNASSLDGLPGLWSAIRDDGGYVWVGRVRNWLRRHEDEIDVVKTSLLCFLLAMTVLRWMGYE